MQENYGKQEYDIGQDNVCGMVRYFRCDEDYNKIKKKVLAIAQMDYLDGNRSQGKKCVFQMVNVKNIDDAFDLGNWDIIFVI